MFLFLGWSFESVISHPFPHLINELYKTCDMFNSFGIRQQKEARSASRRKCSLFYGRVKGEQFFCTEPLNYYCSRILYGEELLVVWNYMIWLLCNKPDPLLKSLIFHPKYISGECFNTDNIWNQRDTKQCYCETDKVPIVSSQYFNKNR